MSIVLDVIQIILNITTIILILMLIRENKNHWRM